MPDRPWEAIQAEAYARQLTKVDDAAFAWLLDLVFTHDGQAGEAKALIVKALRYYARRIGKKPPKRVRPKRR